MEIIKNSLFIMDGILDTIQSGIFWVLLKLDAIIYTFIDWIYQIIMILAGGNILKDNTLIEQLVNRLYIIIGVVVLFIVAYSLLRNMIKPDEALKGKESPVKLIANVIISIVLIALIPTIFNFAMGFQTALLKQNTIGKIILGDSYADGSGNNYNSESVIADGGFGMAQTVFQAFFQPNTNIEAEEGTNKGYCTGTSIDNQEECITLDGIEDNTTGGTTDYTNWWEHNVSIPKNFFAISQLSGLVAEEKINYTFIISTLAGAFVVFVLVSYAIDIALRLVKLSVYQLIAPLPILCRIVPQDTAKKVFSNWLKATISTYTEVFIRLGILYFCILIIEIVKDNFLNIFSIMTGNIAINPATILKFNGLSIAATTVNPVIILIAQALVILGIVLFIKQAPQIIKEITGLDSGKYNVLKSAKQGISFIAGGIAGRSPIAAARAWEQAGESKKLTDFSAIGNQFKRRIAAADARQLQRNAGIGRFQRGTMGVNNAMRRAFGFDDLKQQADTNFENNKGLDGKRFTANNDTTTDINVRVRDAHGNLIPFTAGTTGIELSSENVNILNERKAQNAIAKSQIAEQVRQYKNVTDSNDKIKAFKKEMEEKAKDEMKKGKYYLKDSAGGALTLDDGHGHSISGDHTQAEYEAWLETMKNNGTISAESAATLSQKLQTSINKHTVDHFVTNNGHFDGKSNDDIISMKSRLQQMVNLQHVINADGSISTDGRTNAITSKAAIDISWDEVGKLKDLIDEVGRDVSQRIERENINKAGYDNEDTAIDRILDQGKKQVESAKNDPRYKAYEASSKAHELNNKNKN